MADTFLLMHNAIIQLSSLLFGIIVGLLVGWLAAEEIPLYQKQLGFLSLILFSATFTIPLFFIENWIPLAIVGVTYAILAALRREREWYFLTAPLVLFLSSQNSIAFFITVVIVFLATGMMTLRLLPEFVLDTVHEKKLVFQKELFSSLVAAYAQFVVFTLIIYGIIWLI